MLFKISGVRRRRGSSLVEASLVLGLFTFLFIGIVDVSQVLVMHQGLVERVRAGARYGVVHPFDADKIRNVVLYNTASPPSGARPLLNLEPSVVQAQLIDSGSSGARIEVRITGYRFRFFTPLIKGDYPARPVVCTMPVEGDSGALY